MKRLLLLFLFVSNLSFAQYFSNQESEIVSTYNDSLEPDLGLDADDGDGDPPPAEEDAPIDDYLIYLTILGVLLGVMVHNSKTKIRV